VSVLSFAISLLFLCAWLFVFFPFYYDHHYLIWVDEELGVDPTHCGDDGATV